jgi:hypothetical protein
MTEIDTIRVMYKKYIAEGLRQAQIETNSIVPDGSAIICQTYSQLAAYNSICGLPIKVADIASSFEFVLAVPQGTRSNISISFREYMEMNALYPDL